ncbi:hypothetical protein GJ496_004559 [Pomphorhynchus laevis]|nr:hypothetical protein GJ496_004559 [Pomphorhynchus laevis]
MSDVTDSEGELANYICYRTDRCDRIGSEVILHIHCSIVATLLEAKSYHDVETLWATISLPNRQSIVVVGITNAWELFQTVLLDLLRRYSPNKVREVGMHSKPQFDSEFRRELKLNLEPIYELEVDKVPGAASVEKCNHITTVDFDGLFGYMKVMFTHKSEQHCCQTRIVMMSVDHVDTRFLFRFQATYFGKCPTLPRPLHVLLRTGHADLTCHPRPQKKQTLVVAARTAGSFVD